MRDYAQTIISQYSDSPIMTALISTINDWIDPSANLEQFYDLIWNVDTAQQYGLDVWGRIVNVDRNLNVPITKYFGFAEATNLSADPFGQSAFYVEGEPLTNQYTLLDDYFRTLILAKAASNITDCSIPSINKILLLLFPDNKAYVTDNASAEYQHFGFAEAHDALTFQDVDAIFGDSYAGNVHRMEISYVFRFQPTFDETAIINQAGVLPRPAGTKVIQTISQPVPENLVFNKFAVFNFTSDIAAALLSRSSIDYAAFIQTLDYEATTIPPIRPQVSYQFDPALAAEAFKSDTYASTLNAQIDASTSITVAPYWPYIPAALDFDALSTIVLNDNVKLNSLIDYQCSYSNSYSPASSNAATFNVTASTSVAKSDTGLYSGDMGYSCTISVNQNSVTQVIGFNVQNYEASNDTSATVEVTAGYSSTISVSNPSGGTSVVIGFNVQNYGS